MADSAESLALPGLRVRAADAPAGAVWTTCSSPILLSGSAELSRIIAPVAGIGFIATLACHVGLWFGVDLTGGRWMVLFIGIVIVWLPTVMSLQRLGPTLQRMDGWKVALFGAPDWMRHLLYGIVAYGILNFFLGFFGAFSIEGIGFWRVGSSHAMIFYAAAWALATAANAREDQGIDWKCERGHEMSPVARFCEECGAPARRVRVPPA